MESRVVYIIYNIELFVASITLSSQLVIAHVTHSPELLIASRALR